MIDSKMKDILNKRQKSIEIELVDFSSKDREPSCLEIDFPIVELNKVASVEASSGAAVKPPYQYMKWWARRPSMVFRALALASLMKAPSDRSKAASQILDVLYSDASDNDLFKNTVVADIFMGSGVSIVEASRLGAQIYGNDLNPIPWLMVSNNFREVDSKKLKDINDSLVSKLEDRFSSYYAFDCPHHGKSGKVVYTFWAKHGTCVRSGCFHRTPLLTSLIIAEKSFTVKAWSDYKCKKCGSMFDIEDAENRLAPTSRLVLGKNEPSFTSLKKGLKFTCPNCSEMGEESFISKKPSKKKITITILIDPSWAHGLSSEKGGSMDESCTDNLKWLEDRASNSSLIEVRGDVPNSIDGFETTNGTMPKKASFVCQEHSCGTLQEISDSNRKFGKLAPSAPYAYQVYCESCNNENTLNNGRLFYPANQIDGLVQSLQEWERLKDELLKDFWPKDELPFGFMTSVANGNISENYGYTHWYKMFNERQLLVHASILREIMILDENESIKSYLLSAFQQYLRFNCTFTIWHKNNNQIAAHFSNNNYYPKNTFIETSFFSTVGDGSWRSAFKSIENCLDWLDKPWDLMSTESHLLDAMGVKNEGSAKTVKIDSNDKVNKSKGIISCKSSTDLDHIKNESVDLVLTDPPFGGLIHYSELSDYFYVWLKIGLEKLYPKIFQSHLSPKALEAVENTARNGKEASDTYKKILTDCWREAHRILKPGGMLVFTFHHSEDDPWVVVLQSLFEAGFYLEATYPIRCDQTKGEGSKPGTFGSQKIEYDIVHVCRKKEGAPTPISWAKVRKKLLRDIDDIREMIENHVRAGLPEADLKVIKCGKALEYYSRHYDQVYIENGRHFTVKEALAGVTQYVLDDQRRTDDLPPIEAEPLTRHFLRIFKKVESLPRDQVQKMTRWSGVSAGDFMEKGWIEQKKKDFVIVSPLEIAKSMKRKPRSSISRDYDQAVFLVGACYEDSGINVKETLNNDNFKVHPAIGPILSWLSKYGGNSDVRNAATRAHKIYEDWVSKNKQAVSSQLRLFEEI